jgi:hypothetical protein
METFFPHPLETLSEKTRLPEWTTEKRRMPKWNGAQNLYSCPQVLRKLQPGIPRETCLVNRDAAIERGTLAKGEANRLRILATEIYGNDGGLNPYPISGGTCSGWPRAVSDEIRRYVVRAQNWNSLALAWHLYAGKRFRTSPVF